MAAIESSRDLIIQTERIEEATQFYESVLGLPVFSRDAALVGIETGALRLFIEPGPRLGPVLEFLVDDVQATKTKLLKAGCVVEEEDPAIPRCYLRDPFGLVFNLGRR